MMISPSGYKEEHKNLSLVELIDKRNELIRSLNDYENNHIKEIKPHNNEEIVKPSLSTKYYWRNEYLKEITNLIIEKLDEERKQQLESR